MTDKLSVGLIGAGRMGVPMGAHWLRAGHRLATYDPRPDAADRLVASGATREASPAAVAARSDIIVVLVGYPDQVDACMEGDDGILGALRPDSIVIITSTTSPRQVRRLAVAVRARGAELLDAPVARAEQAAHSGTLLWFVGGDPAALERARSTMAVCGPDIHHVGDVGSGQVAKGINNMLLWAAVVSNREALELAAAFNLDEEKLRTALLDSSAASWAMAHWDLMHTTPWAHKDMVLTIDMADEARLSLPLAALLRERVKDKWKERGVELPEHD
jgi:3-hydroxyisobutyrate dehydrogenase-like beta-hydroxyacid dehydrogenase